LTLSTTYVRWYTELFITTIIFWAYYYIIITIITLGFSVF